MRKKKNIYIVQYEKLSAFLNGLNEIDVTNLESGKYELKFELVNKKELNKKSKSHILSFDEFTLQSIISDLNKMKTREEGIILLTSKCSSRFDFETLAKKMDIPFQKSDTIERLKEKIIESSIGYKLRSQAIQGSKGKE